MRSQGFAPVTTTIIASTPEQILLLCFLLPGKHQWVPSTNTWRKSRSSLKWGEGSCFLHHSLPPLPLINGNRFVWIHPLNWIPGLQGVTSGKTCLNQEGRMMCIFGGDGKTVPVVITWLFGLLKPQFPQSKSLMCLRHSQFGGWLITMK